MLRAVLAMALAIGMVGGAAAQSRPGPPHDWVLGVWTGGMFPAIETEGPACLGAATVIFTRDVVLRASSLDVAYRQRVIETAAARATGLEFRFVPVTSPPGLLGGRQPFDLGFGCPGGPDVLRVERRGPDEIAFPDCGEFPSPLKRCLTR